MDNTIFNFSFEKVANLMKDNFPYRSEDGMKRDAEILYYYLIQKYGTPQFHQIFKKIIEIDNYSPSEYTKIMSYFATTIVNPLYEDNH